MDVEGEPPKKTMENTTITSSTVKTEKEVKKGVVYLSRIPPTMTPHELRMYLEPFGKLGRIYLAPDEKTLKSGHLRSNNPRDHRKARFTEGWVEFVRRKDAKNAALALNGTLMGGKKSSRFHDEIWTLKYLKNFEWMDLNAQNVYQRAVKQQRLRVELSQGRKADQHYIQQAEKAMEREKMEEKRAMKMAKKDGSDVKVKSRDERDKEQLAILKKQFKQRKVIPQAE